MSWAAVRWAVEAATDSRLTTPQRVVLFALAYHHNERGGACTPSNETLRAETGLSRRAVQLAIQALEASGLVRVSARSVRGIQTSNQYDLIRTSAGRTSCARGGAGNGTAGAHEVHPNSYRPSGSAHNVTPFPCQRRKVQ